MADDEESVIYREVLDAIRRGDRKIVINDYEFEYDAGVELEALDAAVAAGGAGITHFGITRTIVEEAAEIFDAIGDTLARCPGLRTLVLRDMLGEANHNAGDEGTPALVRAVTKILREHPMLTELDLGYNDLDLSTVSAMLAAAAATSTPKGVGALERLRLGFNSFGINYTHPDTPPDASVLFSILPRLTVLDVSDSFFDDDVVCQLVTLATGSTRIRELYVGGKVESAAVYDALSALVSERGPKTLVRLEVPVELSLLPPLTAFIQRAVANPRLEHLGFAGCVPPEDPGSALLLTPLEFPVAALFCGAVKSIRLFRILLTPSSRAELFAAIARSSSITALSLAEMGFDAAGWGALGRSLTTTDATMGCGVQILDTRHFVGPRPRLEPFWENLRLRREDRSHNFALRRVYHRTLSGVSLQEVALQDHYRVPHVRFVARTRVLCQAGRARADGVGVVKTLNWLCERAPLWVVVHVCALLRDAEEGLWQRARLRADLLDDGDLLDD